MARIAKQLGKPLFPWQRYVVDVALEVDPATGELAYDEVIVLVPRRSGKTVLIEPVTTHRCGRRGETRQAWITAQKRDNAVKRWRDTSEVIVRAIGEPTVRRTISNMGEALRWPATGSKFVPFAPDEDSMHGEDPDLVWVDELWSFSLAQKQAIQKGYRPAWSVKAGQEWKLSAAGTARSEWLKADRMRGRAAVESQGHARIAFFEWCVPEVVDGGPVAELEDDRLISVILDNHPRRDHGVRPGFLFEELADLGRAAVLRAYGGLDEDDTADESVIPADVLAARFTVDRIPERVRVAFGLQVDEQRREASISAAWRDAGGRALTQVLDSRPGSSWAAARAAELVASNDGANSVGAVTVLNAGPARNVADELDRAGVPVLRVSQTDYGAGCAVVEDQLTDGRLTHDNDPRLLDAFRVAAWRRMGGSRVWAPTAGVPITVLDAHTLAVWGFDHMPDPEPAPAPFRIY
ncbi:hypothetical protein BKA15_000199 [Microlunatus parietis]|uniref:Phage terminase-like protein, large subunit, contains N-terminal HTH domain n=1 Tax=Microlunatus parietis TaxID=682979 RepID=A0A7Y9I261_9ACTN|nr:hypothetical protein [Microlunatus parietis]